MASVYLIASLTIFLILPQPMTASSDFLSPLLSPILDDVCNKVECGKGKCKPTHNSTFLFECECDNGWKQTRPKDDHSLKFLPCIVPNCTINSDCKAAPSSVQEKSTKSNESVFDPCYWIDCGSGSCNKTSPFTHSCECAQGYYNLFNASLFSCYKECAFGMDCAALGISMFNQSTTSPPSPALPDSVKNQAGSNFLRNYHWLIVLVMSLAMLERQN